jgi:hypothetical protein
MEAALANAARDRDIITRNTPSYTDDLLKEETVWFIAQSVGKLGVVSKPVYGIVG